MPSRPQTTLALVSLAMLIVSLDQYIVVVALPEIGRDLAFSDQALQSVVSAYAVASAGFLLLGGRLADVLGRRCMLVTGLAIYAGASLVGASATFPGLLLIARSAQGFGGALVFPATLSLVNTTFPEGRERDGAVAVWGAAGAAGLVIGVLLGGVLTHAFGWAAVFLINVPLAVPVAILALVYIPGDHHSATGRGLDLPGAISVTLGLTALVFALVQGPSLGWRSALVVATGAASLGFLIGFAVIERHSADPLVSPQLVGNPNLRTSAAIAFLFWATFGSVLYLVSIYLQEIRGYDALEAGVGFLLPTTIVVPGSALAGPMTTRFGLRRTLVVALAIGTFGAVVLSRAFSIDGSYVGLIPGLIAVSVGDGIAFTAIFLAASTGVADEQQGVAAGIASTSTSIGGAVGLALLVLAANSGTTGLAGHELRGAQAAGLQSATLLVAVGITAAAFLATRIRSEPDRNTRRKFIDWKPYRCRG